MDMMHGDMVVMSCKRHEISFKPCSRHEQPAGLTGDIFAELCVKETKSGLGYHETGFRKKPIQV